MSALARYDEACKAVAQCKTVDEAKDLRDKAEAMRFYSHAAGNYELEADAAEIRERAERRLGELIKAGKDAGQIAEGRPPKNCSDQEQFPRIKLGDIGIDRKLSSRSQKKAGIGEQAYEAMLARMRADIIDRKRSADVLKGSAQQVQQQARADLQQTLSDRTAELSPDGRRFPVIYADPATRFRAGIGNRSIENHYPTMSIEDICALPVAARCLPDAQLFIWSTVPQLANTIARILPAWGFAYSSHCMWDKTSPDLENEVGTGLVFRNQHEVLIYATKGSPPGPAVRPPSIYRERKREHSRKPEYYRQMITDMTRGLPVLELFAREDGANVLPPNFFTWGNQSKNTAEQVEPVDAAGAPLMHDADGVIEDVQTLAAASAAAHATISDSYPDMPDFLRRQP